MRLGRDITLGGSRRLPVPGDELGDQFYGMRWDPLEYVVQIVTRVDSEARAGRKNRIQHRGDSQERQKTESRRCVRVRGANRRLWHLVNFESLYLGAGVGFGGGGALLSTGSVWPGRPYLGIISRSFLYLLLI